MSKAAEANPQEMVAVQVRLTRKAARQLARLAIAERNQILLAAADQLEAREAEILKAISGIVEEIIDEYQRIDNSQSLSTQGHHLPGRG